MRLFEFADYKTKDGRTITFKIHPDSEVMPNSGWVLDTMDAYVDGKHAGYIKVSYIPRKNFKRYYPNLLYYLNNFAGKHMLPRDITTGKRPFEDLTLDETKEFIKHSALEVPEYSQLYFSNEGFAKMFPNPNKKELLDFFYKKMMPVIDKKFSEKYKRFKQFHVDKPMVDFIRVFDEDEDINRLDKNSDNFKQQGIGRALYFKMAEYLKEKGFRLHASGLQQPEAKAAWEKFDQEGHVQHHKQLDRKSLKVEQEEDNI